MLICISRVHCFRRLLWSRRFNGEGLVGNCRLTRQDRTDFLGRAHVKEAVIAVALPDTVDERRFKWSAATTRNSKTRLFDQHFIREPHPVFLNREEWRPILCRNAPGLIRVASPTPPPACFQTSFSGSNPQTSEPRLAGAAASPDRSTLFRTSR